MRQRDLIMYNKTVDVCLEYAINHYKAPGNVEIYHIIEYLIAEEAPLRAYIMYLR